MDATGRVGTASPSGIETGECPPGPAAYDPVCEAGGWGPVIVLIGIVVIILALTVALVLRLKEEEPPFSPRMSRLVLATTIGIGALLVAFLAFPGGPIVAGIPASVATMVAFLLAGSSLRPRGSNGRGVVVGAVAYAVLGSVVVSIISTLSGTSLVAIASEPLPFLLGAILWPALIGAHLGGYIG